MFFLGGETGVRAMGKNKKLTLRGFPFFCAWEKWGISFTFPKILDFCRRGKNKKTFFFFLFRWIYGDAGDSSMGKFPFSSGYIKFAKKKKKKIITRGALIPYVLYVLRRLGA